MSPLVLRPDDPSHLAGYTLESRLGQGGQGVVYLGRAAAGEPVAIKWLKAELASDETSVGRFLREARVAERVAEFCTAKVLATGIEDGRPYIVSEYVEGPSLRQIITSEGPRSGAALHRLAISTVTALAAIHAAGIVHRDFKPDNVIIGADGPRVIDFGISRALDMTMTLTSSVMGTPAYMSPEQFGGEVGPASDVFSWASTMVYAATGRPPFGDDSVPTVLGRLLNGKPDVSGLTGPLRDVVLSCLRKKPARRPTADEVLHRLLRSAPATPAALEEEEPATTAPDVSPPRPRRTRLLGAAAVALTAMVVTGLVTPWERLPALGTNARPAPAATRAAAVPVANLSSTALPQPQAVLYENPGDAVTVTGYQVWDEKDDVRTWQRRPGGAFEESTDSRELAVSPGGRYRATRSATYDDDDFETITVTEPSTTAEFTVRIVRLPQRVEIVGWSRDGGKLLLNIANKDKYAGFAIVDVATRSARTATVSDGVTREKGFGWGPGDDTVVGLDGDNGLRVFDRFGTKRRDLPAVGLPAGEAAGVFSPSGRQFVTRCGEAEEGTQCLWGTATGALTRRVTSDCSAVIGWYDEEHLYCWYPLIEPSNYAVQIVNLSGKSVRRLLETKDAEYVDFFFAAK